MKGCIKLSVKAWMGFGVLFAVTSNTVLSAQLDSVDVSEVQTEAQLALSARASFTAKDYAKAFTTYEAAAKLNTQNRMEYTYHAGLAKMQLADNQDAMVHFKQVADSHDKKWAKAAQKQIEWINDYTPRERKESFQKPQTEGLKKPWTVAFGLHVDKDNNVEQSPTNKKHNTRTGYNASGVYEFIKTDDKAVGASVYALGTLTTGGSNFISDQFGASAYFKKNKVPFQWRFVPYAQLVRLGRDAHSSMVGANPGLSFQNTDWTWTNVDLNVYKKNSRITPDFAEENMDGHYKSLIASQNMNLKNAFISGQNTFFSIGALLGRHDAGSSQDYNAAGANVVLFQNFPKDITAFLNYQFERDCYTNGNVRSDTLQKRRDTLQSVNLNISKKILKLGSSKSESSLSVYADGAYTHNRSNLSSNYTYRQLIGSLGLQWVM